MPISPWILAQPPANPAVRLFCFPYAGATAGVFVPWQQDLGPEIEVCALQLPGRGARFREACLTQWPTLIDPLIQAVAQHNDLPFSFFGHSLGSLIAFELARAFAERALPEPSHLFVSAANAPQACVTRPDVTRMDDKALLSSLRDYNGTPAEVLNNSELMELLLPILRADLVLLQNYKYEVRPRLSIPITVMTGTDDSHINYLDQWQAETTGAFERQEFPGDHFYIEPQRRPLLNLLRQELIRRL